MAKQIRYCEICGVSSETKRVTNRKAYGQVLCQKHYMQLKKHGAILDTNKYTVYDLNRYKVVDDVVYMDICDSHQNVVGVALYDKRFLDQVSSRKWKRAIKRRLMYVSSIAKDDEPGFHVYLHQYVMWLAGIDTKGFEIDHINGNPLDNRLSNLRLVTRQDQMMNLAPRFTNKYGIRGISKDSKNNKFTVDFAIKKQRLYLKPFKTIEEAVYARYITECICLDKYATQRHYPAMEPYINKLSKEQKDEIETYVCKIIVDNNYLDRIWSKNKSA